MTELTTREKDDNMIAIVNIAMRELNPTQRRWLRDDTAKRLWDPSRVAEINCDDQIER